MQMQDKTFQVFSGLLSQSPTLLTYVIGFLFAVAWWSRHPRTSLLVCLSLGIMLVTAVITTAMNFAIPQMMSQRGMSGQQLSGIFMVVNLVRNVGLAGGLCILIYAAFSGRTPVDNESRGPTNY